MENIIKNQKRSSVKLYLIMMISATMIGQLSFGSSYTGSRTETEEVQPSKSYALQLQQDPRFPGQGQKLGGIETSSILVPENPYLYSKDTKNLILNAERLIEESLRGPKEQAAALFFYGAPFVIDKITRMPVLYTVDGAPVMQGEKQQTLPSLDQILQKIDTSALSYESQEKTIEVLEIYLRAIDEAKQVAKIEAYFDANQQNFYFYQTANATLTDILDKKATMIRSKLDAVKKAIPSQTDITFTYEKIRFTNPNHIIFSIPQVAKIIKDNDFRTKIENRSDKQELMKAAELLIKQCFIAQQQHLKDNVRFESINKESKEIKQNDYIFEGFPSFEKLIGIASHIANKDKKSANKLFKHINQAVQTALYIAKRESNYYITTDPFVKILYDMHKQVDAYCVNREYGATTEDVNRNAMWATLTTAGYGLAIAGAAATAYYYKDVPSQIGSTIYNNSKAVKALDKKTNQVLTDAQKKLLATGQYVLDAAGNVVPNIGQAIKNADQAVADYFDPKTINPKTINPSYLTQVQKTWEDFNWDKTTQGWKNIDFQNRKFVADPMIEQYQ